MTNSLATVLASIPRSDEQLAKDIGISSKTIKRIRTWTYKPTHLTESKIVDYLDNLWLNIIEYLRSWSYAQHWYEMSDYPILSRVTLPWDAK